MKKLILALSLLCSVAIGMESEQVGWPQWLGISWLGQKLGLLSVENKILSEEESKKILQDTALPCLLDDWLGKNTADGHPLLTENIYNEPVFNENITEEDLEKSNLGIPIEAFKNAIACGNRQKRHNQRFKLILQNEHSALREFTEESSRHKAVNYENPIVNEYGTEIFYPEEEVENIPDEPLRPIVPPDTAYSDAHTEPEPSVSCPTIQLQRWYSWYPLSPTYTVGTVGLTWYLARNVSFKKIKLVTKNLARTCVHLITKISTQYRQRNSCNRES